MELRQAGIEAPVLAMADTLRANFPAMLDYKLTPAVQALDDLAVFDGLVRARGRWVPMRGTVSMDMTTIDATDVPELKAGEADIRLIRPSNRWASSPANEKVQAGRYTKVRGAL